MKFLKWKCLNLYQNFTGPSSQLSDYNDPALVQIVVLRQASDKPLSELMTAYSADAYKCVTRPQWYFFSQHNYVFIICVISWRWNDTGSCHPSPWKTLVHSSYIVNAIAADNLATQGARSSVAIATQHTKDPFYEHSLIVILACISNYLHYEVWDEITYPLPNFNGCYVEAW